MAKRMLSIEVGCSATKIVEMDYQSKKPRVYRCVDVKTPEGAVRDGYLNPEKMEVLKDAVKEALKANKIRTKRVLFTVFSGKIITREIVLPGVKTHQINAIIESNVTEYFPIELSDYKITHMHISTFREGENVGKHKVLVIAAEKVLIEGYEKLAEQLGLNIVDIDYAGNSVFQATKQSAGAEAIMAVKVEGENALVTIIRQGTMVMQRTVNYNIGYQDDEPVSMDDAARVLVGTVLRVIDFYVSNNEDNRIEQIYIMGDGSKESMILDMMVEQTQLPCRVLDTVRGTVIGKKAEFVPLNVFAAAIGAGISSVGFDADKEKERHETNYVSASVLMILFFIVMTGALLSFALIPYNSALMEQKDLEKKQQQYEPARVVHDQYLGMKQLLSKVRYGHALTERSNDSILDFLSELEDKMPADVEFTEFVSDDEQCVITMRVADKETAAGVIEIFRDFESLLSVTVESITEEKDGDGKDISEEDGSSTIYFTINCVYVVTEYEDPALAATEVSDESAAAAESVE